MTIEFTSWPKIARLNRDIVITEKLDGTNSAIGVTEDGQVYAQSRTRLITPEQDNFGLAQWVEDNADNLRDLLGVGVHFGEWWGRGIQRGYGLESRRFSLFNTRRWSDGLPPHSEDIGVSVVPVLYQGPFDQSMIEDCIWELRNYGSMAVDNYMNPEGVVIYHRAAGMMFKVTLKNDAAPKGMN